MPCTSIHLKIFWASQKHFWQVNDGLSGHPPETCGGGFPDKSIIDGPHGIIWTEVKKQNSLFFFYGPKVFEPAQNILWHKSKWHKFSANSFDIEPLCYFDRHADKKVLIKTVSI